MHSVDLVIVRVDAVSCMLAQGTKVMSHISQSVILCLDGLHTSRPYTLSRPLPQGLHSLPLDLGLFDGFLQVLCILTDDVCNSNALRLLCAVTLKRYRLL